MQKIRKIPWRRGQPTPVFLFRKAHGHWKQARLQYIGLQGKKLRGWACDQISCIWILPFSWSSVLRNLTQPQEYFMFEGSRHQDVESRVFSRTSAPQETPLQKKSVCATLLPLLSSHECSWRGYLFNVGRLNRSPFVKENSGRVRHQIQQIARHFS